MMKKIFLLVAFFVLGKMWSYAQYPITQNIGADSTIVVSKGALQSRLINMLFTDTAQANTQRIRQYAGAQIATTTGGNLNLWVRNATATAWLPINTGSGNNIYTIDGTLLGNRTLTGAGYSLTFNQLSKLLFNADSTTINTDQATILNNGVSTLNVKGATGRIFLMDTTAPADERIYELKSSNGEFYISILNDAQTSNDSAFLITSASRVGINTLNPDSTLKVGGGVNILGGLRVGDLPTSPGTKQLRINAQGQFSVTDTLIDAGGTVTSVGTNNGSGITGGPITTTGTLAIDTTNVIATKASVSGGLAGKLNLSDTAAMLAPYLRAIDTASLSNRINTKLNISDTATMLGNYLNNVGYGLSKAGQVASADSATLSAYYLRRKDSLTVTNPLGYVTQKILADTAAAIRSSDLGGTVTSVATNDGTGITGGTITTSGTLAIDTTIISTRAWRQKGVDSLQANINLKLNISDTASMLNPYLRKVDTASLSNRINQKLNISDTASMLTNYVNNVGYGLSKAGQVVSADSATLSAYYLRRKDSLTTTNPLGYVTRKILADTAAAIRSADAGGTVTSVATNNGTGITGGTITTSGTLAIDTLLISTRAWRQKGIDSVAALANTKISGSLISGYLTKATGTLTVDTSQLYQSSGLIGIGTTSPTQKLQVSGNAYVNGQLFAGDTALSTYQVEGILSTPYVLGRKAVDNTLSTEARPTGIQGHVVGRGSIANRLQGGTFYATTDSASTANSTGSLRGITSWSSHNGSGSLTTAWGGYNIVQNKTTGTITNAYGSVSGVENRGATSTINKLHGTTTEIWNNYGGTIDTAFGQVISIYNNNAASNIGAVYGLSIGKGLISASGGTHYWRNSGTIGTSYGLYLDSSIDVGTTKYALFSNSNSNSYFRAKLGIGTTSPDSAFQVATGAYFQRGIRASGLPQAAGTKALRIDASGTISVADTLIDAGGTVTSVATNNGTGITGGTITTTGTLAIDTLLISTRAWRQKGIDSVAALINSNVSGTTNYVAKFTGTNTIGNSQLFDNGTNVGIGTSSPSFSLDVATANARIRVAPSTTTNYALFQATNAGNTAYLGLDNSTGGLSGTAYALNVYHNGAYPIVFSTSGTNRMWLDASGNLGIGTSSPSTYGKLAVVGAGLTEGYTVNTSTTSQAAWFSQNNSGTKTGILQYGSAQAAYGALGGGEGALYSNGIMTLMTDGSGYLKFATGGNTERMRLDASGNLGIGTSSPAAKLEVTSSSLPTIISNTGTGGVYQSVLSLRSTSPSYGAGIQFYDGTNDGYISWYNQGLYFAGTGGATRMLINSSGNVGIGTSSPNRTLTVNGLLGVTNGTANTQQLVFSIDGTAAYLTSSYIGSSSYVPMAFEVGGAERARITSGGNLLVGTTTDAGYKLDVNGVIHNNNAVFVSQGVQGNASGFTFSGLGSNYGRIYEVSNDKWVLGYSASYGGASTVVLSWNASGNVGIGTTSPVSKFQTKFDDLTGTAQLREVVLQAQSNGANNSLNSLVGVTFTTAFSAYAGGNLNRTSGIYGINTDNTEYGRSMGLVFYTSNTDANATEKMRIASNGAVRLNAYGSGSFTGTPAYNLSVDASGNIIETPGSVISGSGTTNYIPKFTSSSAIGNSVITDNGSLVQINNNNTSSVLRLGTTTGGLYVIQDFYTNSARTGYIQAYDNGTTIRVFDIAADANINLRLSGTTQQFLTGGSERMRLDASGRLGLGTSSPAYKLDIYGGASGTRTDVFVANAAANYNIGVLSDNNGFASTTNAMLFYTGASERMRLDASGNLGLGTSSPTSKLDVQGAISLGAVALPSAGVARLYSRNTDNNLYIQTSTGNNFYLLDGSQNSMYTVSPTSHLWLINNSTRMTLDASGNLGLGVTPSAWSVFDKVLQVGGASVSNYQNADNTMFGSNMYYGGSPANFRYITNGTASLYRMDAAEHKWFNAPSGTAGNAISFTQAMTLASTGNLLVGGTSDNGSRLNVTGKYYASASLADNIIEVINSDATNGYGLYIRAGGTASNRYVARFKNGADSDVMWVGTSNVGIGTTSPTFPLDIRGNVNVQSTTTAQLFLQSNSGGYLSSINVGGTGNGLGYTSGEMYFANSSNAIIFNTKASSGESMRITSGGNVGIGNTTPLNGVSGGGLQITNSTAAYVRVNATGFTGLDLIQGTDGTGYLFQRDNNDIRFGTNNAERMRITSGGDVLVATTTASFPGAGRGNITIGGSSSSILSFQTGGSNRGYLYHDGTGLYLNNFVSGSLSLMTNNTDRLWITSGGNVLVGTTTDAGYKFDVAGSLRNTTSAYFATSSGSVGIGTTSPDASTKLQVESSSSSSLRVVSSAASGGDLYITSVNGSGESKIDKQGAAGPLTFYNNGSERMRLTSSGELLINTTTDAGAYYLQVNGDVYASAYYESSDLRLKNVLSERKGSDGINTIAFKWKDGRDSLTHIGYAAQQVEKVLPDAVKTNPNGYKTINYDEVQSLKIANLEQEIAELKKIIKQLIDKK